MKEPFDRVDHLRPVENRFAPEARFGRMVEAI
jgi:hypothetical protein